jgi:hypothetical protein
MNKLIICLLFFSSAWYALAQNGQAIIVELQGKVEIKAAGASEWKPAAQGDIIENATVVSTGFKSTAILSLGDSSLTVLPLTMLTLEELLQKEDAEEVRLYLRSGRVRAEVSPPLGSSIDFTIRSPIITASVRGTSFEFDGKFLRVENGAVLLENNNRQRGYVAGGQQSYVDETDQYRIVPPFEVEATLLTPMLPDLVRITGGAVQEPVIPAVSSSNSLPDTSKAPNSTVETTIEWP